MTDIITCGLCGSPVRVVGHTTKSFEPVNAHEHSFLRVTLERDEARREAAALAETLALKSQALNVSEREEVTLMNRELKLVRELWLAESAESAKLIEALSLIASPPRPDGTYNRDREACEELAKEALARYDAWRSKP